MSQNTSRRYFLGAATAASAARVWGANDDIRVGIVGFNSKGKTHIDAFSKMSGVRVVALCDADSKILERGVVNRVPAGLSLLHAAVSEPICSVLASHVELGIEAGETVAVIGSGPMGILHFELLRAREVNTILIDLSAGRLERARSDFGAARTIDASKEDPVARVREMTGGIGADVAITAAFSVFLPFSN